MNRHNNSDNRIYVGNLPDNVRVREVEDIFSKYGKIVNVDIKLGRGGRGPAFAFLEFDDPRDADDAIRGRDGYEFDGQRLRVETPSSSRGGFGGGSSSSRDRFSGRGARRGGRGRGGGPPARSNYRVLLSGLPNTGSWQDIKDHMREAGEVIYADVFRDGTGIVEFSKKDDMKWAVKNLDDTKFKSHEGESSNVRVKLDESQRLASRSRSKSRSPRRSRSRERSRSPRRSRSRERSRSPRRSRSNSR